MLAAATCLGSAFFTFLPSHFLTFYCGSAAPSVPPRLREMNSLTSSAVWRWSTALSQRELEVALRHHVQHARGQRLVGKPGFLGPGA